MIQTKKIKKYKYCFKLEAYDIKILQHADLLWKNLANSLNLELKGPVFLPAKQKKIILLKSPHINKKAREKFIFRRYRYLYTLKVSSEQMELAYQFLFVIQKSAIAGCSFTIKKTTKSKIKLLRWSFRK